MKTKLRKHLALILTVCMCISICPVTAFAETEEVEIEAVTATAQPMDSTASGPVTLTTASVFPAEHYFYVKFEGLEGADYYQVQVQTGSNSEVRYLHPNADEPVVTSMYYNLPLGSNSVTLIIGDEQGNALYKPVTLTTQVVEALPATLEEIQAFSESVEVSSLDSSMYVSTNLPVGTLTGSEKLSLELVKDGVVYAATTEDSYCQVYTNSLWDSRYAEILDEDTYVPLSAQAVRCEVYCGRELVEGNYDARLYADGELISTHKNAVVCYSQPIVSGRLYSSVAGTHNVIGSKMAGITLDITNGDPADFSVELYLRGEKVAVSTGYRVINASTTDCEAVYYIPLEEPMEKEQEYEFRVKYAKEGDFIMESSDLFQYIYEKVATDRETIQFGSYYYANFVLPSFGYDAGVKYKYELYSWNKLLATAYASPNNDGFFNLEFRDENGQLIELERDTEYKISFYGNLNNPNRESCTWYLYNQYLRREAALALMSAAEPHVLNVEYADASLVSEEQIFVQVIGEEADTVYNEKDKYQLHLTSVTGEEYLLDVETANQYNDGYVAEIEFSVPEDFEDAYYYVELLYNGKLVVTESGENVFAYSDLVNFSRQAEVGIARGRSREVQAVIGVNPYMLDGKDVTVELFSMLNDTAEPDCTLTLTEKNDYMVTDADKAKLNPAVRYKAVISAEGKALNITEYEYWASDLAMRKSYDACGTATVAEGMEDYLEIVPCYTNYDEEAGIPYFSEVYVNVTAPEGKALQYITVDGEKICGNGFLFTEDCEVSAIFEDVETVTFKATVQMGVYEYIYGDEDMTEAELEELLGNMTPEEREEFIANGNSGRVFKVLHSYERNLPPNSMQELDLSLPATLNQYKIYNIDVKCTDPEQWAGVSHDGTETRWFLDMPECDVVVKVELEEKQSYRVSTQYDNSLGTVTGLESDYVYVTEGETVSFTATPNEGNLLNEVYYEYYSYQNGSWGAHKTPLTPDENGVYSFVMPDRAVDLYVVFTTSGPYTVNAYPYGLGTVSVSDPASAEGYMAGETVTLYLAPEEGSRLQRKDGIEGVYWFGDTSGVYYVEFTKVDDATYTFVMPHADVKIEVRYEITPAVAPGGTVVDNDTLIEALGGAENAALNTQTGAVQLLQNVELQSPIMFNPTVVTEFILDLNGYRIVAVEENIEESGAIILHENGLAQLTLDSTRDDAVITTDGQPRNNFHLVWVRGGKLTLAPQEYIFFYGAYAYHENSAAGIRVAGGVVDLMENFEVHGNGSGEALWASGGTTTVHGGSYFGGCDYYNQLAGELELLGGVEDYSWVTSRSLGGSGIRVSGRAKVDLLGEYIWATGGPNSAALHIDSKVSVDTPCVVNVYDGSYDGDYGKGLLVQSAYADLTIHYGQFRAGYANNAYYSVDVQNCGVVADYLAPDRKVENLNRYVDYVDGENIYEEVPAEDLQRSYLYDDIRVSDSPNIVVNDALDAVMKETATAEEIQQAVENLNSATLKEVLVAEPDQSGEETNVVEKLERLEAKLEIETSIEASGQMTEIFAGDLNMIGAAFNADEGSDEVTVTIDVKKSEEEPSEEKYSGGIQFSMTISGAADAETYNDGHQLEVPVLLVLPLPSGINPALLTVLHYNEATNVWEELDLRVYEEDGKWFVAFATDGFSDYALKHKLTASKAATSVSITMEATAFAKKDAQFLCAVYSQQGQMLGAAPVNADGNTRIELGDKAAQAYEVKVFTTGKSNGWTPLFGEETILLGNASN